MLILDARKLGISSLFGVVACLCGGCVGEGSGGVGAEPAGGGQTSAEPIDASRCSTVSCDPTPLADSPCCAEVRACDAPATVTLRADLRVDVDEGAVQKIVLAPDGTAWTLLRDEAAQWVEHYTADGQLVGRGPRMEVEGGPAFTVADLSAGGDGHAWVVSYTQTVGETADDAFSEWVTLDEFDADGALLHAPLALTGLGGSLVAAGPGGDVTLAGNAANNAHQGSLLRLTQAGEPRFVQSGVQTDGQGVNAGIAGLLVHADGSTTILSQLSQSLGGETVFGVSRFDAVGTPGGYWAVPTIFAGGYTGALAGDANDNLVVAGMVGDSTSVVETFPGDGRVSWAFEVPANYTPSVAFDSGRGRVFAGAWGGVAVIASSGASCGIAELPPEIGFLSLPPGSLAFGNGALYYADSLGFGRLSVSE